MPEAILRLTDGTTTISLLEEPGIHLQDWTPAITDYKGGGVWQDSPLANFRQLADSRWANAIETFSVIVSCHDADDLARVMQDLHRLIEKANDYWDTSWQDEPVWIEAKAACETNTRYAIVRRGYIPEHDNPYAQPFLQETGAVFGTESTPLQIIIERDAWRDNAPGSSTCVAISGAQTFCYPSYLVCDGDTQDVDCGSDAGLDDLPDNAVAGKGQITVDGWIYASSYGEGNQGRIATKTNWTFRVDNAAGLVASINCAAQNAISHSGLDEFTADGSWHHVAMTYDETGAGTPAARTIYIAIDGIWVASYPVQQVSIGNYTTDAAANLFLANNAGGTAGFDGRMGWMRVSGIVRFNPGGGDFAPPPRCTFPGPDCLGLWIREGTGTAIDNGQGTAARDGTATTAAWGCDCTNAFGRGEIVTAGCSPCFLDFDGAASLVNCGSNAALDDLPTAAPFTVEAWIRIRGWGEGPSGNDAGRIFSKEQATGGDAWYFSVGYSGGLGFLDFRANYTLRDRHSASIPGSLTPGVWHHVCVDDKTSGSLLFIDGVQPAYTVQDTALGAYVADNANDLHIGNRTGADRTFDGGIGWCRISDNSRYGGANFTPPPRCTLPDIDGNTVGQWIGAECTGTAIENQEGTAARDGIASNSFWGCDCTSTAYGATCGEEQIYIANKHNLAQLTHIWRYTAAAFEFANFVDDTDYTLLIGGAGNIVYFGIDTSAVDSGPFCSLVFDIATASGGAATWEYWNAGWVALTVQDNTNADGAGTGNPLDTTGVKSVHWVQPSDWITTTVNGITGYWVRLRDTSGTTNPVQQNRRVYTIVWPDVDADELQVPGDIPALLRVQVRNQSDDNFTAGTPPELWANRILMGLRSASRGTNFTPYLNAADEQNPTGITVTTPGTANFATDVQSPTGRIVQGLNLPGVWETQINWLFTGSLANEYKGIYHAFVRVNQLTGAAGDIQLRLYHGTEPDILGETTAAGTPHTTADFTVVDLGQINIPPSAQFTNANISVYSIQLQTLGNTTSDMDFYDLILLPVDEWAGDFQPTASAALAGIGGRTNTPEPNTLIDVDSVIFPKANIRALLRLNDNDQVESVFQLITGGEAILQANADQHLWFFMVEDDATDWTAPFEIANSVQVWRVARYLSLRGAQ